MTKLSEMIEKMATLYANSYGQFLEPYQYLELKDEFKIAFNSDEGKQILRLVVDELMKNVDDVSMFDYDKWFSEFTGSEDDTKA